MINLKPGQVLWLKAKVTDDLLSEIEHPYLILSIVEDEIALVNIGQLDSVKGYELAKKSVKLIRFLEPKELVISKDSYIRLDTRICIEYYDGLSNYLHTMHALSKDKFQDILRAYEEYQCAHIIPDNKNLYFTKEEIEEWNV